MSSSLKASPELEVDLELIRRLDKNGPRYTSYPTADRFVESFNAESYGNWIARRETDRPLSLYFHIPFCNTLCFYCACNKVITKDRSLSEKYVQYMIKELDMQAALLGEGQRVEQLHWGGGTPTFLSDDQMRELMNATRKHFTMVEDGEYSIEIDPRKVSDETIALLAELGFNRISIGVQDFDPQVQKAVNRIQSEEETLQVINAARANGFKSVSIDLIYGLPKQTLAGVKATLDKVIAANPDRLSIYNYAHMPTLFMPQRRIHEEDLPAPQTKLDILSLGGQDADRCGLCVYRHGSLCQAGRRTGGGAAPAQAAPQLSGLFHAFRLRPRRHWSEFHRQDRPYLQPELSRAGRLL